MPGARDRRRNDRRAGPGAGRASGTGCDPDCPDPAWHWPGSRLRALPRARQSRCLYDLGRATKEEPTCQLRERTTSPRCAPSYEATIASAQQARRRLPPGLSAPSTGLCSTKRRLAQASDRVFPARGPALSGIQAIDGSARSSESAKQDAAAGGGARHQSRHSRRPTAVLPEVRRHAARADHWRSAP